MIILYLKRNNAFTKIHAKVTKNVSGRILEVICVRTHIGNAHCNNQKETVKNLKQILHLLCVFSFCRPDEFIDKECLTSVDCHKEKEWCAEIDGKNKCVKIVDLPLDFLGLNKEKMLKSH